MKICVLGATGLVGRETLTLIDLAWPDAEIDLYASRDQTLAHAGRNLEVKAAPRLEEASARGGDVAFVALDDSHSARYVPRLLELGYRVIDKSNTFRMDPQVPLVVAGVNHQRVVQDTKLVANPNCTTIPLALAVAPLQRRFGLESATVSSYQAISGAGIGALRNFHASTAGSYEGDDPDLIGETLDAAAYPGNVVPHSGKTDETGFSSEERKLVNESRKILEMPDFRICAQCCRVPVAVGHYENVWLTLREPATVDAIENALADDDAVFIRAVRGPAGDGLTSLACVHDRDRALVGRVRLDPRDASGRSLCLTVAADNLRLGAATNAVRIASCWMPSHDPEFQVPAR